MNGPGEVIGQGAVKLVKAGVTLSLLLSEFDARRLSLAVFDYIRAWKQAHFAELARARVRSPPMRRVASTVRISGQRRMPRATGRSGWPPANLESQPGWRDGLP